MRVISLFGVAMLCAPVFAYAQSHPNSVYVTAPEDPRAIFVKGVGDGIADDSAAIQAAIDAAAEPGQGKLVYLPEGRYRITRTIFQRTGVRIFGIGAKRPVIVLADNTPGFGSGIAAMISFTGEDQYRSGKPAQPPPTSVPANPTIFDATSSTFYTTLTNINFEIGKGNSGAIGVRGRVAQHGFLRHVEMRLGSGLAGLYQAGNEAENLRFIGGRYGILTEKTSPAWQYTVLDSVFEGQRDSAIREHEVRLTLANVTFRNTPVGIDIDRGYSDSVWGKDVRFENVSTAGIIISNENKVFTQIGFDNALATNTPTFARFRDSGKTVAGQGRSYRVSDFSYGLTLPGLGQVGEYATHVKIEPLSRMPALRAPAIRALPPVKEWVNVHTLGVKGDDESDDTAALQRAVDAHRVLYFPLGRYRLSDSIKLRPDSVLIAMHPGYMHLYLADEAPAYAGVGSAKGLLESARGGDAILHGLGLWTGGVNPRASAIIWRAGANSMINDVKIQGGGGTYLSKGSPISYADPRARFDGQHPSIWVTDGGGGTFAAIWSPNTLSSSGFYVSDTKTPGYVYQLSAEHHHRNEILLDNVENWEFLAPQTEQEVRDGTYAISTEIRNSRNILFANYHGYRVTRTARPMDAAVKLYHSSDIRFRNFHVNAESAFASCDSKGCGTFVRASKFPFENSIKDMTSGQEVREREFARLDLPKGASKVASALGEAIPVSPGVKKLAGNFYSIGGAAADANGKLYFIDRFHQTIHGWSEAEGLTNAVDPTVDAVSLAIDASGKLLVLSSVGHNGTVFSVDPKKPREINMIQPTPTKPNAGARVALPGNVWANGEFADRINPVTYEYPPIADFFINKMAEPKSQEYVSPDGSLVLPAFRVWNQGPDDHRGWRWSDTLNTYGFVTAKPGERIYLTNASENQTYTGIVGEAGTVRDLKVVANRGGESVARDQAGNLYVANGQVFIYDESGKEKGRIDVPERPLQMVIGGADGRTLYILSHNSLYSVRI